MKTIKEWLQTLPEPYRGLALFNLKTVPMAVGRAAVPMRSLADALFDAFFWDESPEGNTFWSEVHDLALSGKFNRQDIDCPDTGGNMREWLNELEQLSDHRILCSNAADKVAVFEELHKQGYAWPSHRPLAGSFTSTAPRVIFTYANGAPGRVGKKIVLQSTGAVGITAENQIVTAAQWLRGYKPFNGVDCTIQERT